ncbi:MAG: hypothetical protein ACR2NB_15150, partial [Solirubrobacteraceae bacterium]
LRALIEEHGEMPKAEAAMAIGLTSAKGSFPRILRRAAEAGLVIRGTHVVSPGPNIAQRPQETAASPASPQPKAT